jgi:hypothetical protein
MEKKLVTLYLMFITFIGMAQTDTKTRNYELDEFNKIIIHGGGNLQIHHSGKHSLEVKSNKACDEIIDFSVSSKTLYIRINDSGINGCGITIGVGVPSLIELIQNGGGNVVFKEGFSPQNSFMCEINGGGNIDVSEVSVNSFYASIEGGGVILLHAEKELEGNISGGGLIEYSGDPKVKSNVSGGGAINKK